MNNPLAFIDPDGLDPLFIGTYDKLTDEQKRLFETYVKQNYAEELKNPLFSAESLWNGSAAVANGDAAAGPNSRLLDDGQLTNFLGVTNMLEKRGVIDQVASISEIHGDAPEGHTYRIIGELKNNSSALEAIKKAFPNSIRGKGHGKYSEVLVNRDYSVLRTAKFRVCLRRLASTSMSTIDAYFVWDTYRKVGLALTFASEHTTKMAESGMGLCGRCQGPKTQSCEQNPYISKVPIRSVRRRRSRCY